MDGCPEFTDRDFPDNGHQTAGMILVHMGEYQQINMPDAFFRKEIDGTDTSAFSLIFRVHGTAAIDQHYKLPVFTFLFLSSNKDGFTITNVNKRNVHKFSSIQIRTHRRNRLLSSSSETSFGQPVTLYHAAAAVSEKPSSFVNLISIVNVYECNKSHHFQMTFSN